MYFQIIFLTDLFLVHGRLSKLDKYYSKFFLNEMIDNWKLKHMQCTFPSFIAREKSYEFYTKSSRCQLCISYEMLLKGFHLHSSIKRWVNPIPYHVEVLDVQSYAPKWELQGVWKCNMCNGISLHHIFEGSFQAVLKGNLQPYIVCA